MILVRHEAPEDYAAIRALLLDSFEGSDEADLIEELRRGPDLVLALVAEDRGDVVGHVAFSRVRVEDEEAVHQAVALAPLAVRPEFRTLGIATQLIREAHACLAAIGETLSIVLGEPDFYRRFGYSRDKAVEFESDYQSRYLLAASFGQVPATGTLVYAAPFGPLGTPESADAAPAAPADLTSADATPSRAEEVVNLEKLEAELVQEIAKTNGKDASL
jgi:putative acetyltransferase